MLSWTPVVVSDWTEFSYYKEWHETATISSGFMKPAPSDAALLPSTVDLPKEVEDAIQQALPLYEAMYAVRMKPTLKL